MTSKKPIIPKGFDFDYFDNPQALGYRGYSDVSSGDQFVRSWNDIAHFCQAKNIGSVIDIGCAKGFLVRALRHHSIDAIGYDVSDYALEFARDLPCYKHSILDGIPRSADAVFCLGVLLYIERDLIPSVLQVIHGATRDWFFFSSFYLNDEQSIPDPLRQTVETRKWWRDAISTAGFQFISEEEYFDVYTR